MIPVHSIITIHYSASCYVSATLAVTPAAPRLRAPLQERRLGARIASKY